MDLQLKMNRLMKPWICNKWFIRVWFKNKRTWVCNYFTNENRNNTNWFIFLTYQIIKYKLDLEGFGCKYGVTVLNTPGTIDADYRGEIKVILINLGDEPFIVEKVIELHKEFCLSFKSNKINLIEVINLDENSGRGTGGFGSTGVK
jgi:dUTPase